MLERLKLLKERYEELHALMADPKVISDRQKYQKCAKELSELKEVVSLADEYERVCAHISEAEAILKDTGQSREMTDLAREELEGLNKKRDALRSELEETFLEDDPQADKNIIMEIRAGTGGIEASLFAADLFRMYSRYAAGKGWAVEAMTSNVTEKGGFKEVIFSVEGRNAYKNLKYESGVHRVQRVPETEASGRIHTSAVSVAVLPEAEEIDIRIDPKDLKIDVFRSSGPGGQGVNTTDSAVRITHLPTNTVVTCQDERSQLKNKAKAMKVLRARLMDRQVNRQQAEITQKRRTQIGTGDRSEKIRTYNFPDGRVNEHRINLTLYKLQEILQGNLDVIIRPLLEAEKQKKLKEGA